MDIMKYGSDVEVMSPPNLRKKIKDELKTALSLY
jgi:predicted DNA-binding transcriptional regulator YafY